MSVLIAITGVSAIILIAFLGYAAFLYHTGYLTVPDEQDTAPPTTDNKENKKSIRSAVRDEVKEVDNDEQTESQSEQDD